MSNLILDDYESGLFGLNATTAPHLTLSVCGCVGWMVFKSLNKMCVRRGKTVTRVRAPDLSSVGADSETSQSSVSRKRDRQPLFSCEPKRAEKKSKPVPKRVRFNLPKKVRFNLPKKVKTVSRK
jgi:hypothetical protein